MPERYRAAFDGEAIQEHAAIVARRAGLVHIEIWQRPPEGGVVLCIVADDQPGLLSLISAALVVQDIDIGAVKAYTRTHPETERAEAIDLVWVKRDRTPALALTPADVRRIGDVLTALVMGEATVESALRKNRPLQAAASAAPNLVAFDAGPEDGPAHLTVETVDRPGMLLAITRALFQSGIQIIASDATTRNGRVIDRFTLVERDGSPVGRPRRGAVQREVLSAIEALVRLTSKTRSTRPPKRREP